MKEPGWRTWTQTAVVTFLLSCLVVYLMGGGFTWAECVRQVGYAVGWATLIWLIALARWHRANSRM